MMSNYCFGIDIGGTTVKCGLFSSDGILIEKSEIPTDKTDNGGHILDDIKDHIDNIIKQHNISIQDITGIGMGVPGAVTEDGVVNKCINLGWDVFNVEKTMSDKTGMKVKVGNDANLAALGEYWMGGAKGYSSSIMITVGTGVGGGVIIDGKPLYGCNGAAGEIGHLPIVEGETEKCNCGKTGCLEQAASATGIVRVAKRTLESIDEPSSLRNIHNITAKDVFDEAKNGDELALYVVDTVSKYLAKGLACAACFIDPECFIIGGGVSKAGEFFIDRIAAFYKESAFHSSRQTKILPAKLGNDAGIYGAARLVQQ